MKVPVFNRALYKASPALSTPKLLLLSPHFYIHSNLQNPSTPMAACIDTQTNQLSRDPNRSSSDDDRYQFMNCRRSFSDQVSCAPICQNRTKTTQTRRIVEDLDPDEDLWLRMQDEARSDIDDEPILSNYYHTSILSHASLESALAHHLSERDPACVSYSHCLLNFKGFLACQAHRAAHKLWSQGRKVLALLIQNRVSEVFAVDIHPGAKIGSGILLDHATGLVVGETAVIGNDVSILHSVTLGGTGKASGDRHPKIGDGVLIGAGTCILGNIRIGEGAKVGAGSVVIKDVPARTTVVGNPARLIGGKNPVKLDTMPSSTMDHTSNIAEWCDYVI
ncbi:hypothetical protein C1H46_020030 [Malus baccata]|uniref:serine O-acetyltransferase n=1 Tax=Malus baccata TaxID=106549 RepID=A0A540M6H1_MALBA|nr:hypothetical protein C1H46_020030 [Malus baccata]